MGRIDIHYAAVCKLYLGVHYVNSVRVVWAVDSTVFIQYLPSAATTCRNANRPRLTAQPLGPGTDRTLQTFLNMKDYMLDILGEFPQLHQWS